MAQLVRISGTKCCSARIFDRTDCFSIHSVRSKNEQDRCMKFSLKWAGGLFMYLVVTYLKEINNCDALLTTFVSYDSNLRARIELCQGHKKRHWFLCDKFLLRCMPFRWNYSVNLQLVLVWQERIMDLPGVFSFELQNWFREGCSYTLLSLHAWFSGRQRNESYYRF